MKKLAGLVMLFLALPQAAAADCVILLHGLARSSTSMQVLSWRLRSLGYGTVNVDYPSTDYSIAELADLVVAPAVEKCAFSARMHIVTHSLGGIIVRQYLSENTPENLGRVVMLAPPNKGSQVIDELRDLPGFELWNGPAGVELGTGPDSLPNRLGPVNFDLGVIAGNQSLNPLFSSIIDGEDDGKVSVESTKVAGMADHIVMPFTHTFMMNSPEVARQVVFFLQNGFFDK
jgi:triacylglycerol lipase